MVAQKGKDLLLKIFEGTAYETVAGPFQASALEYSGQYNGEVMFELALESAGAISFEVL